MPSSNYPYLNRGPYKWVPDDFALTSGSEMGFTRAYYPAQVDFGLPANCMPAETPGSEYARSVRVFGKGLCGFSGESLGSGVIEAKDHAEVMSAPFLKTLVRGLDSHLQELPIPQDSDGIGLQYDGESTDPPWLFVGTDDRRSAGILLKHALSMDTSIYGNEMTTPMSLVAIYDKNAVGSLWLGTGRQDDTSSWGPPTRKFQDAEGYEDIIFQVATQLGIGTENLAAAYVPFYLFDSQDQLSMLSVQELQVSDTSGQSVGNSYENLFRLSGDSWSIVDYFPRLVGFVIGPNMNPLSNGERPWKKGPWKAVVLKIGEYDAVKANGMPARGGEPAQFPCKIFGYALRMNQAVQMGKDTSQLQPAIGKTMSRNPGNGLGTRISTFWFKLFNPDPEHASLGFAHGLRFYYLIASLPIPGTSPLYGGASLGSVLFAMEADQDLIMVQYITVLAGWQMLNFSFGESQHGTDVGRVAYSGAYGGYSRQISSLAAFRNQGKGTPNLDWTQLGHSDLPSVDPNGVRAMWYDPEGNSSSYYSFTEASLGGGFTPAIEGFPRTDLSDRGSFAMSLSGSSSMGGSRRVQAYSKPALAGRGKPSDYCSEANAKAHLATFVSDGMSFGNSALLYVGNWRIKFNVFADDTSRLNSQVFFRFAIVDGEEWDKEPNRNGHALWNMSKIKEFHFENIGGRWLIASGAPTNWDDNLISTPTLGVTDKAYDLLWFVEGVKPGDSSFSSQTPSGATGDSASSETRITFDISSSDGLSESAAEMKDPRIVVQAWSVASPRTGVSTAITPQTDRSYPAVSLSWAGDTGSFFQTTFIKTISGTLFPQQDPFVVQAGSQAYDRVAVIDMGPGPSQSEGAGCRDVSKYGSVLDFSTSPSEIPILAEVVKMGEEAPQNSNISLVNFRPDSYYEPSVDYAQSADLLLTDSDGGRIVIAGSTIDVESAKMSFDYETNRSTFDVAAEIELQAVFLDGRASYTLAKSPRFTIRTGGSDAAAATAGKIENLALQGGPVGGLVPQENVYLGIRVRLWPFNNANSKISIKGADGAEWNRAFCSLDLGNFRIEGMNLEILNEYRYVTGMGGQDFYQDLPISTPRTFGASDYTFVPDADVLKTQIIVPKAATSDQFGYWYFTGTLFSPFYMFDDEMPYGSVFSTRGGSVLLSGNAANKTLPDGIWIRTAVDEVQSQGMSSDQEAIPFGGAGLLARPRSATESTGNFMTVMSLAGSDVDGTRMENIVKRGGEVVSGKNPLIVTLNREHGYPGSTMRFRSNVNAQTKILLYEDEELSDRAGSPVIAMLLNRDGSCMNWQSPPVDSASDGKVVLDNYMRMLAGAVSPVNATLHVAGYRPVDSGIPERGGAIVLKSFSSGLVSGVESTTLGPYHYVDGTLVTDEGNPNYSWSTGSGPLMPPPVDSSGEETVLASNGWGLPVAESFPDLLVDRADGVHVFYPLMTRDNDEADLALGKIFCRSSNNGGYSFADPVPIMDLGYRAAKNTGWAGKLSANDSSFDLRHPVVLYNDRDGIFVMFAWAGGKIFMKTFTHPGGMSYDSTGVVDLIAGDTSFAIREPGTGLEGWLRYNWDLGFQQARSNLFGSEDSYASSYYASDSDKTNNYAMQDPSDANKNSGGMMPWVRIVRYYNEIDVPSQRVGAFMDTNQEISLFYNDSLGNLIYRRVRTKGAAPHVSPPFILSTTTL